MTTSTIFQVGDKVKRSGFDGAVIAVHTEAPLVGSYDVRLRAGVVVVPGSELTAAGR